MESSSVTVPSFKKFYVDTGTGLGGQCVSHIVLSMLDIQNNSLKVKINRTICFK